MNDRPAREGLIGLADLVRPHLETDQRIGTEGMGDRHVGCVTPLRD
jgi:hypothetical protein